MVTIMFYTFGLMISFASALPVEVRSTEYPESLAAVAHPRNAHASWQASATLSSVHSWAPSIAASWTPSTVASWAPSSAASTALSSAASWAPSSALSSNPSAVPSRAAPIIASHASPAATHSPLSQRPDNADVYVLYRGDGTTAQGWPNQDSWLDFDTMWEKNQAIISGSCTQFGQENNSPSEIAYLLSAIKAVSSSSEVDPRFILAVTLQESGGCVRAPTTFGSVFNPGLMQDYDGTGTCNNGGIVRNPCPGSEILQMIKDGTAGTYGPGLVQDLEAANTSDVSRYYKAARIYNSGSIPFDGDLVDAGATPCYASDIANRLTGWVNARSRCSL